MEDKKIRIIEEKIIDFRRYAFILLSLSIFLFLGLVSPNEPSYIQPIHLIVSIFIVLGFALYFHRKSSFYQKKLYEEQ